MPDMLRLHHRQRLNKDHLQGWQRTFKNVVQAHFAATLLQLRPIQSGSFASSIDRHEKVFAVPISRGFDVIDQTVFLQVERGTDRLTATATEQQVQFVERDFAGGQPDVERFRGEHGCIQRFCESGCVPALVQRHNIVKASNREHMV